MIGGSPRFDIFFKASIHSICCLESVIRPWSPRRPILRPPRGCRQKDGRTEGQKKLAVYLVLPPRLHPPFPRAREGQCVVSHHGNGRRVLEVARTIGAFAADLSSKLSPSIFRGGGGDPTTTTPRKLGREGRVLRCKGPSGDAGGQFRGNPQQTSHQSGCLSFWE